MEPENKIPVTVIGVKQIVNNQIVVLLQEEDTLENGRILPIFIGGYESQAIDLGLKGIETPRPLTHDLLQTFIEELDAEVIGVEIVDMRDRTYFADIVIARNPELKSESSQGTISEDLEAEEYIRISARPSDAIALAVRVGCPVYVFERLMDEGAFRLDKSFSGEEVEFSGEFGDDYTIDFQPDTVEDLDEIIDQFKDFIGDVKPGDFENIEDPDSED